MSKDIESKKHELKEKVAKKMGINSTPKGALSKAEKGEKMNPSTGKKGGKGVNKSFPNYSYKGGK